MQKILYLEPATCGCGNGKYVESIIYDLVIVCDEIIEMTKTVFNKICSNKNCSNKEHFNKLLYFASLFTNSIALLIAVSINY